MVRVVRFPVLLAAIARKTQFACISRGPDLRQLFPKPIEGVQYKRVGARSSPRVSPASCCSDLA